MGEVTKYDPNNCTRLRYPTKKKVCYWKILKCLLTKRLLGFANPWVVHIYGYGSILLSI